MGLDQGDQSHPIFRFLATWQFVLAATAIAVALAILGDSGREWFSFDRPALGNGEVWRLISGHFVHLGTSHLLLNLAGLALTWYLVGGAYNRAEWLIITSIVLLSIDCGLWLFEPDLVWYVGLSGLLHGLLAAGLSIELRRGGAEIWLLAAGLVAKLVYEQVAGPLPGSVESSGGPVIVAAHAYGACGGVLAAVMIWIRVRLRASI